MPFPVLHPKIDTAGPRQSVASGVFVNPGIGVLATTGPLAAGDYEVWASVSKYSLANTINCLLEKRDAADAVTQNFLCLACANGMAKVFLGRTTFAANERARINLLTALAAQTLVVNLSWRRVG